MRTYNPNRSDARVDLCRAIPAETAATIEWKCYNDGLPQRVLAGFEFLLLRLRVAPNKDAIIR